METACFLNHLLCERFSLYHSLCLWLARESFARAWVFLQWTLTGFDVSSGENRVTVQCIDHYSVPVYVVLLSAECIIRYEHFFVTISPFSLQCPPVFSSPPHPSPPPAYGGDVAGCTAAEHEEFGDVGGLCFPGDWDGPAAPDRQTEESSAAGPQSQGKCMICRINRSNKTGGFHILTVCF